MGRLILNKQQENIIRLEFQKFNAEIQLGQIVFISNLNLLCFLQNHLPFLPHPVLGRVPRADGGCAASWWGSYGSPGWLAGVRQQPRKGSSVHLSCSPCQEQGEFVWVGRCGISPSQRSAAQPVQEGRGWVPKLQGFSRVCSAGRASGVQLWGARTLHEGKSTPLILGPWSLGSHGERWIPAVGNLEASVGQ